ncbi:hypothetical protein Tco_0981980 [Tanacetum coccineum]
MVHNYYLEEAKKKEQLQKDQALDSKPAVPKLARSPNTANGSKLKPRNSYQEPRNWPPSMSSRDMFSPNKTFTVYVKTTPPSFGLTSKRTSRIFTFVGLRWIPTGKTVGTCLNSNDSAILLGKRTCTPNTVICANSSSLIPSTSTASEPISSKGSTNVNIEEPMIVRNEGCGSRGACEEAWKLLLKPINGAPSLTRISRSSDRD